MAKAACQCCLTETDLGLSQQVCEELMGQLCRKKRPQELAGYLSLQLVVRDDLFGLGTVLDGSERRTVRHAASGLTDLLLLAAGRLMQV